MKLLLIGMNHTTAPVEVRERFAIPDDRLGEAVQSLLTQPGIEEGVIATKGYVTYWTGQVPVGGVDANRTVFHVS